MDRNLIKNYIDSQPTKIIKKLDLPTNKIEYQSISLGRNIKDITGDEEMSRAFVLMLK